MRFLGIDFGLARAGLAMSDPEGIIASPIEAIAYKNIEELLDSLVAITRSKAVGTIVIGNPLHLSGEDSEMSLLARDFADKLAERLPDVKIARFDERFTTKEAERALKAMGVRTGHEKAAVDSVAASLILQAFLD